MRSLFVFLTINLVIILEVYNQNIMHDFGFQYIDNIIVVDEQNELLSKPWVGGMNYCQFSSIDINLDGIKDLLVFDRSGNRKMVFVNQGIGDSSSYVYKRNLAARLPSLKEWVVCLDYNNDGKSDIFTYTTGGIAVFKNASIASELQFQKATDPFIYSLQGSVYTNLYVTPVDLPAISDIDNDGDFDILTFWGLGQYVQLHKNLSVEKYGNSDSLDFELVDACWGDFEENEDNNQITLNIECPFKETGCIPEQTNTKDRHIGSTLLAIDLDGDNDKDMLLGDIDYPSLFMLENGGDNNNAHIINVDTVYPENYPIDLYSFPASFYVDVNNDEVKDLIVSPFDSKTFNPVSDNINTSWFYKNEGTNSSPEFQLKTKGFLQDQMLDFGAGAYPFIVDCNNDGLMDLVVSNYGYRDSSYYQNYTLYSTYKSQLAVLKNMGTNDSPQFKLIDMDLGNLSALKMESLYPSFGDIDNDGDIDMITGYKEGVLDFYENISQGDTLIFAEPIANYQGINVGEYSTPQLFDVNKDGLLDLLIGCKLGSIHFYENTGSLSNPYFEFVDDELGGVDVRDLNASNFGYSTPCFFNYNDETRLFVGSESGKIHYYKNIDENLAGQFELFDENLLFIYEGGRIGIAVSQMNNDEYLDLFIGNFSGGLNYYQGATPPNMKLTELSSFLSQIKVYPQPSSRSIEVKSECMSCAITKVVIYTIEGSQLSQNMYSSAQIVNLDVSNYDSGLYLMEVSVDCNGDKQKVIKKIIIAN